MVLLLDLESSKSSRALQSASKNFSINLAVGIYLITAQAKSCYWNYGSQTNDNGNISFIQPNWRNKQYLRQYRNTKRILNKSDKIQIEYNFNSIFTDLVKIEYLFLENSRVFLEFYDKNIEIGIVIGGGNIFRGMSVSAKGMDRVAADY